MREELPIILQGSIESITRRKTNPLKVVLEIQHLQLGDITELARLME